MRTFSSAHIHFFSSSLTDYKNTHYLQCAKVSSEIHHDGASSLTKPANHENPLYPPLPERRGNLEVLFSEQLSTYVLLKHILEKVMGPAYRRKSQKG